MAGSSAWVWSRRWIGDPPGRRDSSGAAPTRAVWWSWRSKVAQSLPEVLPVVAPHRFIRNGIHHLVDASFETGATFRRVETTAFHLSRPQHVGKWASRGEHVCNCP